MSGSYGQLQQFYLTLLAQQGGGGTTSTLQDVCDNGFETTTSLVSTASATQFSEMTPTDVASQATGLYAGIGVAANFAGLSLNNGAATASLSLESGVLTLDGDTIEIGHTAPDSDLTIRGQAEFELPPHAPEPILGNDVATKGYVDTLIGNYGGNSVPLYFNIPTANPNPILTYPIDEVLGQTLIPVSTPNPADTYYTLRTTALGTDTLIATFTTPVGYPHIAEIPAGLWNMLIYGYSTGTGGQLFYHFHLSELKADTTVVPIAVSGFSSDVNATSSADPDTYHASLAITTPYVMDSLDSRLIVEIYTTGTGAVPTYLYTLFGGIYYSFVSTSLSGGTSILTTNNDWTGNNIWKGALNEFQTDVYAPTPVAGTANNQVATCEFIDTKLLDYANITTTNTFDLLQTFDAGISSQYVEATLPNSAVGLYTGQIAGGNITLGSALVDTTVDGTLKATTPLTNTNNTVVPTTAWVNTFFALASSLSSYLTTAAAASTYQTIAGMTSYLTTADAALTYLTITNASSTYQTLAGMASYLTTAAAASTYQTIAGMTSYLTTADAALTYQTLAGMASYLTTATAASTYATIASLADYGNKLTANTWDVLQTFTNGINTFSVRGAVAATTVSLFDTSTGTINFGSSTSTTNVGLFKMVSNAFNLQTATSAVQICDLQTNGNINFGTNDARSGGQINIGSNVVPAFGQVNARGVLNAQAGMVLSANKFITTTTTGTNSSPTANQIGYVLSSVTFNTTAPTSALNATSVVRGISLTSGVWIILAGVQIASLGSTTQVEWGISTLLLTNQPVSTSFTTSAITYQTKSNGLQQAQQFDTIGIYQNATASAVPVYLNVALTYTSVPVIQTGSYGYMKAIKIA